MAFCNHCGTELADGAKFCAACGAPVAGTGAIRSDANPVPPSAAAPPPRHAAPQPVTSGGPGLGWVLPALVGLAVLAIAYLLFAPKPQTAASTPEAVAGGRSGGEATTGGSAQAAGEAADTAAQGARAASGTVSAAVLDSAFFSNPDGAAARYAGPIRVSGTIATMVQPGPTPALSMEGRTRFNYMVVNFVPGYRERLAPLSKGQFVTVSCAEVRSLGGTTILSGCVLD